MTPQSYVQNKAASSGSSFYYAFLFLPPQKRAAITAFYAFCREVDDVVDDAMDASVAQAKLAWWKQEVLNAFNAQAQHPVMQALMPLTDVFQIKPPHLLSIIEGCEMDLTQTRYLDLPALRKYCHLVAGVVGEVAARIFGQTDPLTTQYAHALGQALQMTNIIRDVGEDALRGRIYIPIDILQQFDVKAHEILNRVDSPRFHALMQHLTDETLAMYERSFELLPHQDARAQKPGLMMASIYKTLLKEIQASNFPVLHQRVALTPIRKLWLAWKVQALGRY
jgi:phytoene synthase